MVLGRVRAVLGGAGEGRSDPGTVLFKGRAFCRGSNRRGCRRCGLRARALKLEIRREDGGNGRGLEKQAGCLPLPGRSSRCGKNSPIGRGGTGKRDLWVSLTKGQIE